MQAINNKKEILPLPAPLALVSQGIPPTRGGRSKFMKEVLIESRMKNNRLHKLIHSKFESISAFCLTIKTNPQYLYALINLHHAPYFTRGQRRGTPTPLAQSIEAALERPVEWIFPFDLYIRAMEKGQHYGQSHKSLVARFECGIEQARSMAISNTFSQRELSLEDQAEKNLGATALNQAMSELQDREQAVLRMRFGIGEDKFPLSLEEVGRKLKFSRERVRQIECRAIRKLRNPRRCKPLRDYTTGVPA